MFGQDWRGGHIAILDNPENGETLPALAVIEEFVRLGLQVTYVTSAKIAAVFDLLNSSEESWRAVGILDDSEEPAATIRGYFYDDNPDFIIYFTNSHIIARELLTDWNVPAAHLASDARAWHSRSSTNPKSAHMREFLARHGLSWISHDDQDH